MYDIIIIGSGPAGLSAAVYTLRANLSTLIIEGSMPGGLVTTTEVIDNYLGLLGTEGIEMANKFTEHVKELGGEFYRGDVKEIVKEQSGFFTITMEGEKKQHLAKAVIYATGSTPKKLNKPGEELSGVSYCATCDGMFFQDEEVILVGGGETAAEEALYLSQLASKVHVFIRKEEWRASRAAVEKVNSKENIIVHFNTEVKEFKGLDGNLESVLTNNGEEFTVNGCFIAVGQTPNSKVAETIARLQSDGFIDAPVVDGFFVAGDVKNPEYRQVIIAAGDGAKAGIDATNYLLFH